MGLFDDISPETGLFDDIQPEGDVVPAQEPRGFRERVVEPTKEKFGQESVGLAPKIAPHLPEAIRPYSRVLTAPVEPLVTGAETMLRGFPALLEGTLPGAAGYGLEKAGVSRGTADKIQRELSEGLHALSPFIGTGVLRSATRVPRPVVRPGEVAPAEKPAAVPEERAAEPERAPEPTAPEREVPPPTAEPEVVAPRKQPGLFDDIPPEEPPAWTTERIPEEAGAEGKPQLVIPGAERISPAEEAQRAVERPLRPTERQLPPDEGLFGEREQADLVDEARRLEREEPAEAPPVPEFGKARLGKDKPETITQFIARNGGLELNDLTKAADFNKIMMGRHGRLARKNGKSIDGYWREALIEAGYLERDPDGGMARDIRNELVDKIQRDRAGEPQYSAYDRAEMEREQARIKPDERTLGIEKYADQIVRAAEDAGSSRADISPEALYSAADLMWRGEVKDPIQALTRVYEGDVEIPTGVRGPGKAVPEGGQFEFGPRAQEGVAPQGWERADAGAVRRRPEPFIHPEVDAGPIESLFEELAGSGSRPLEILRAEPLRDAVSGLDYGGFAKQLQPVAKAFADRLGKLVGDMPVFVIPERDVRALSGLPAGGFLYRHGSDRFIVLNADYVYSHPEFMTHVTLHEGIHAASSNAIEAVPALRNRIGLIMEEAVARRPSLADEYGFTNAKEFVAEVVSNAALQRELQNTPLSARARARLEGYGKLRTLWDVFVESLRQSLGFTPKQRTALEYALTISEEATRSEYARMGMKGEATQDFALLGRKPPPGPEPGLSQMETAAKRVGEKSELGKNIQRGLQDRYGILKTVQQQQERAGIKLPESQRAYEAEGIQPGRTHQQAEEFQRQEVEPFERAVVKSGLTLEDVGRYAEAKHAPERNEKMLREWGAENASGMSNEQAAAVLAQAQASGKAAQLEELADTLQQWRRKTLDILVDGGVMTRDQATAGIVAYPNYVPLKSERDSARAQMIRARALGSKDVVPVGRVTQADNPIGYMVAQRQEAIHLAQENRVRNILAENIRANPVETPTLSWYDNVAPTKRRRNPVTGLVEEELAFGDAKGTKGEITEGKQPMWQWADNVVPYKLKGEQRYMRFEGEDGVRIARAFNRMDPGEISRALQLYGNVTRGMARLLTQYNPAFGPFNFLKDFLEGSINIAEFKGAMPRLYKNLPGAFRGAFEYEMGRTNSRWAQIAAEADRSGARVRFMNLENPTVTFDRMQRQFQGMKQPLSGAGLARGVREVGRYLEFINNVFENATRISAYQTFRELGMSPAKAAFEARELTLNFTRKGEWGSTLGAAYFFANASIQGTARMGRAMKSKRVLTTVGGLAGAQALMSFYNVYFGGTDPSDGQSWYSKVPNWVRKNSFVIMDPRGTGGYIAPLPVPYGYGVIKNAVDLATEAAINPKVSKKEAAAKMLSATVDAFNPLGSDENPAITLVPSAFKPGAQLMLNENFMGFPINPEYRGRSSVGIPGFKQHFRSANPIAVGASKWLSDMTGGTENAPGFIDVRPGTLEHAAGAVGGGLGRTLADVGHMATRAYQGREQVREKIPLVRRFYGSVGFRENQALYFKERTKVDEAHNGKIAGPEADSWKDFNVAEKQRMRLNKQMDKVRADVSLTPRQRDAKIESLQNEQIDFMNRARKALYDRRDAKGQGMKRGGYVKVSKASVHYSKGMPSSHCGICRYYHARTCERVEGAIDPKDWCELFKRKAKMQEGGAVDPVLSEQVGQPVDSAGNPVSQAPEPDPYFNMNQATLDALPDPRVDAFYEANPNASLSEMWAAIPDAGAGSPLGGIGTMNNLARNSFLRDVAGGAMYWGGPGMEIPGSDRPLSPREGAISVNSGLPWGGDAASTNNWQLLPPQFQVPGYQARAGQIINTIAPGFALGLPWGMDPSFSDTAESGAPGANRRVGFGNAVGGMNKWDAYYWPGGQFIGYTRWPIGTNVRRGGRVKRGLV